jgi:ubiquinol oxidase
MNIDSASLVFEDEQGDKIPVMSADYGFRSGAGRLYQDGYGGVPRSILELSISNFKKELMALRRSVRLDEYKEISDRVEQQSVVRKFLYSAGSSVRESLASFDKWLEDENVVRKLNFPKNAMEDKLTEEQVSMLKKVKELRLDDKKVAQAEKDREAREGKVEAPILIRLVYNSLCWALDLLYEGRPIQRFWVLETVARMPYFSYISMLHLYESLGWWRAGAEVRKVHFAEEWNELHHLQIMESLGGDQLWIDRFMAEHAAIFYYWILVLMYAISPSSSYALSELIEHHAVDTYTIFAEQNEEILKSIPPPLVALNYYKSGDLYLFDQLQTGWSGQEPRRPSCNNLHEVFTNIRDDEVEHVKTMHALKSGTLELDQGRMKEAHKRIGSMAIRTLESVDFDE